MDRCVVCGKETEKKHFLANVLVLFDPDSDKVVWKIVFAGEYIPLCEGCAEPYKNILLSVREKIKQVFYAT